MKNKDENQIQITKSQWVFGQIVHYVTIVSCLIALLSPVLIMIFRSSNILNPNLVFDAIFDGKKYDEIWRIANVSFDQIGFWNLLAHNFYKPDGFAYVGIVLGCSVALWGLIPAAIINLRKKQILFGCICIFVATLIVLAMSGILQMAG